MNIIDMAMTLSTLTVLEIVLGIDNLVFLSILTQKLPDHQRKRARYWGLSLAWMARLILLMSALALVKLNQTLFVLWHIPFSVHSLFLLIGGFFLVAKATQEIHYETTSKINFFAAKTKRINFWSVVVQVAMLDIVFSLDSVLTAIGLTNHFWIMASAITIAILCMLYLSTAITRFIQRFPTIKMLALCFLLLIGTLLIADGLAFHIPRDYLYVVMIFSLMVEILNHLRNKNYKKRR